MINFELPFVPVVQAFYMLEVVQMLSFGDVWGVGEP